MIIWGAEVVVWRGWADFWTWLIPKSQLVQYNPSNGYFPTNAPQCSAVLYIVLQCTILHCIMTDRQPLCCAELCIFPHLTFELCAMLHYIVYKGNPSNGYSSLYRTVLTDLLICVSTVLHWNGSTHMFCTSSLHCTELHFYIVVQLVLS